MPRFPSAQGRLNHEPDSTLAVTKTCPKDGVPLSPTLTERGQARMTVLELCDGRRSLGEIETEMLRRHPQLFDTPSAAALFVAEVVTRYAR